MTTFSSQRTGPVSAPPEYRRLLNLTLMSAGLYLLYHIGLLVSNITHQRGGWEAGVPTGDVEMTPELERMMADYAADAALTHLIFLAVAMVLYVLVYIGLKKGLKGFRDVGIVLGILSSFLSILAGYFLIFESALLYFEIYGSLVVDVWAQVVIASGVASGIALLIVNVLWLVTAFKKPVARWFAQQS